MQKNVKNSFLAFLEICTLDVSLFQKREHLAEADKSRRESVSSPLCCFLISSNKGSWPPPHHEVEVEEQNFPFFTFYNKKHKKWQKIKTSVFVPAFNFTSSFGFLEQSASSRELHCIQPGFLSSTRIKSELAWGNEANLGLDWGDQARRPQRIRAG